MLTLAQVAAGVGSLTWLVWAVVQRLGHLLPAALVCGLFALTFIQPLGVRAQAVGGAPADLAQVGPDDRHSSGPLRFRITSHDRVTSDISPESETIRVSSSLWGPFLYSSSKVTDACGLTSDPPCWEENQAQSAERVLVRRGQDFWLTLLDRTRLVDPLGNQASYTWKLSPGITFWPGLVYWLATVVLIGIGLRWRRRSA